MPERKHSPWQPAEFRACGVRLIQENRPKCSSDRAACALIAEKLECSSFTLCEWRIQAERDAGEPGSEQRRQGQDQVAGAREPGIARRQRYPEEGVGLFCPSGAWAFAHGRFGDPRSPFVQNLEHKVQI